MKVLGLFGYPQWSAAGGLGYLGAASLAWVQILRGCQHRGRVRWNEREPLKTWSCCCCCSVLIVAAFYWTFESPSLARDNLRAIDHKKDATKIHRQTRKQTCHDSNTRRAFSPFCVQGSKVVLSKVPLKRWWKQHRDVGDQYALGLCQAPRRRCVWVVCDRISWLVYM